MTTAATGFAAEQCIAACSRFDIEIDIGAGSYGWQRKLVELQCREFAGYAIMVRIDRDVARCALAAIGNCLALSSRSSKKVPMPCISLTATNAFQ